jgi:hypothetical protein
MNSPAIRNLFSTELDHFRATAPVRR